MKITQKEETMSPSTNVNLDQVSGLMIFKETVNYMPKFRDSLAQRLEGLHINKCHLKLIVKEDLKQFPLLRGLSLPDNDLEKLDSDLFDFTPLLEVADFSRNNLKFIGANLLDSLVKIRFVDFSGADCIRRNAQSPGEFDELKVELATKCKNEVPTVASEQREEISENNFTGVLASFAA